jgi:hypothetical protein
LPNAVQTAVHRLRRRYRDPMHAAIEATPTEPWEIEHESRDLFAVLAE